MQLLNIRNYLLNDQASYPRILKSTANKKQGKDKMLHMKHYHF